MTLENSIQNSHMFVCSRSWFEIVLNRHPVVWRGLKAVSDSVAESKSKLHLHPDLIQTKHLSTRPPIEQHTSRYNYKMSLGKSPRGL